MEAGFMIIPFLGEPVLRAGARWGRSNTVLVAKSIDLPGIPQQSGQGAIEQGGEPYGRGGLAFSTVAWAAL
jgi:hypothetical protein